MKDELKFDELQNWLANHEAVYASRTGNDGYRIRLSVTCNGNFIVRKGHDIHWQGMQPFIAIEKFNELV